MIKQNGNQKYIEFGTGDIKITSGLIGGVPVIGLNEVAQRTIGEIDDTSLTIETLPLSDVYMVFNSIKSLEVLILKLQESRSMAIDPEWEEYDYGGFDNITDIYQANEIIRG